jgi:hypothetical protein
MQTVAEQLGKRNLEAFRPHSTLVSADALGVEIELEGFTDEDVTTANRHLNPLWVSHRDGSLRNGGIEFVTSGGLGGEQLHQAYKRIVHCLETHVNYDATWRCSTHMHINMLDFTIPQVVKFLLAYTASEPILFEHNGAYRRSSNFCTPVADSMAFHKKLIGRLTPDTISSRWGAQSCNKYTALNLQPLFGDGRSCPPLGTVEFRGGRPMTTMEDLLVQTNLLLSIKEFAKTHEGTVDDFMGLLNEGVYARIFNNGTAEQFRHIPVEVLEEAVVNAWVLLKSHNKGLAEYSSRRAVEEQAIAVQRATPQMFASWNAPQPVHIPERSSDVVQPFWMLSGPPVIACIEDIGGEAINWPRLHGGWGSLCAMSKANQGVTGRVILIEHGFSARQANMIVLNWMLNCDVLASEQTIHGTLLRALRHKVQHPRFSAVETYTVAAVGNTGEMASIAARNISGTFAVNYREALSATALGQLFSALTIGEHSSDRRIALHLQRISVRVRGLTVLKEALARRSSLVDSPDQVQISGSLPVSTLRFLLRWAQLPSIDHVHPQDLMKYDRTCRAMDIVWENGLLVPVHMDALPHCNVVYFTDRIEDHMGLYVSDETRDTRTNTWSTLAIH